MIFDICNNIEKIGENNKCTFFLEKDLTNYIQKDDETNGNRGLIGYRVVLAEFKNDEPRSFLIFNSNNEVVQECSGYESACISIDLLKFTNMK